MKKNITIQLHCSNFPGRVVADCQNVYVGVQRGDEIIFEVPGDTSSHNFELTVQVGENKDGSPNFLGSFVHGPVGGRFLYLVWFDKNGAVRMRFCRAKINLQHLGWPEIEAAILNQEPIKAQVFLTDKKGGPACATLKPENINWF